jgi:glycosyltransferase involved in cell wall biosynthesis
MTVVRTTPAPEVSVVIIFKDADEFLEEAIESVGLQTLRNWELLLVDDGSTDNSTSIAIRHVEQDGERLRYLEHPEHANLGMSAARNLGVSRARGEFVAFLDADDVLVPAALEEQVALLRANPQAGMVYGPLEYWYGWTGEPGDAARDFVYPVGVPTGRLYEPPTLISLFIQDIAFAPSGMLLRRALIEQVGGYEDSFRDLYEDQVFAAKICRTTPVYISGRCWYRYRQHPKACCQTAQREGRLDSSREPFLHWLLAYLEQEGLAGGDAWRLARLELDRRHLGSRVRLAAKRRLGVRRLATLLGGFGEGDG